MKKDNGREDAGDRDHGSWLSKMVLLGVVYLAARAFRAELPALRRYMNIERM